MFRSRIFVCGIFQNLITVPMSKLTARVWNVKFVRFEKDMKLKLNFEIELDSTNAFEIYQYFGVFSIFYLTGEVQIKSSWTIFFILTLIENVIVYLGDF